MKKVIHLLGKYESLIFLIFVILNSSPILIGKYFPTMDGAAHLYNAQIIEKIVFSPSSFFTEFFHINHEIIPNWLGHFLLVVFNLIFPEFISEKLLLLIISIGIPFVGRKIILHINPNNSLISFLLLPFVFSTSFILGFYNFSLGVLLFLCTLYFWMSVKVKVLKFYHLFILSILLLLLYFAHALVFLITLSGLALYLFYNFIIKKDNKKFKKNILFLLIASIIPLIFFANYSLNRNVLKESEYLETSTLTEQLISMDTLIGYNKPIEQTYLNILFLCVFFLFSIQFYKRFQKKNKKWIFTDYWLIFSVCILIGYYLLPNSGGGAGFISMRLAYLFFILIIIWISSQEKINKTILALIVALNLYGSFKTIIYYNNVVKDLNTVVHSIEDLSNKIPEKSIVIPFDFSNHWIMNHFSNYLSVNKEILVLENYEASLYYFPTQMNMKSFPNAVIKGAELNNCPSWLRNSNNSFEIAKYIFILGVLNNANQNCINELTGNLDLNYNLEFKNSHCSLYRLID